MSTVVWAKIVLFFNTIVMLLGLVLVLLHPTSHHMKCLTASVVLAGVAGIAAAFHGKAGKVQLVYPMLLLVAQVLIVQHISYNIAQQAQLCRLHATGSVYERTHLGTTADGVEVHVLDKVGEEIDPVVLEACFHDVKDTAWIAASVLALVFSSLVLCWSRMVRTAADEAEGRANAHRAIEEGTCDPAEKLPLTANL